MGHITEAEEKKGKKEQDKGQIDIGKKTKKKNNLERGTGISLRLLPIILAGIFEGTTVASKALHLNTRCTFKRQRKGERQYLTAFTGLVPEADHGQVPSCLKTNCISSLFFTRPSLLPFPFAFIWRNILSIYFFSFSLLSFSSSILPHYYHRW